MLKVLIADIGDDTRKVLRRILEDDGYACVFARESGTVIDTVYNELPDIIMLDLALSEPGALEILQRLKSAPSTRDIAVMLLSQRKPKRKLAKGYELGAYDYVSQPYFKEEVLARIRSITEVRERVNELEKLLDRDYLTGLYNRNFFMNRFHEETEWTVKYKEPLSLMMFDIDHFKKVNDTYGHVCGDEILKQLAGVLLAVLGREHVVARYGGEEFIALLPNVNSEAAFVLAEKLRLAVQEKPFLFDDGLTHCAALSLTVSIGMTTYNGDVGTFADQLIGQADSALYSAKEGGRNRVMNSVP